MVVAAGKTAALAPRRQLNLEGFVARELDKQYDHQKVEPKWGPVWEELGVFHAEEESSKPPFCLVIPPPNVTGALHMGHALTYSIQDCIVRWKRMSGFNALWLPGTDHAGIATQMLVERKLKSEGVTRDELGREKFLERVWEWKDHYHGRITEQSKRLGISVDWQRERFTLDEGLSRAVREAFVTLYEEGLIYRARRMVNWSPGIRTVLSDLEVEHKDVQGSFWYVRYPVEGDEGQGITVATTRPETMLGDTAVAVHSEDERYKGLIGRRVVLPLTGRSIPVVADDILADPTKGTGAVKVTPAHDPNDFECGLRNNLEFIDILDDSAHLNQSVPEKYRGLERFEARRVVVEDLEAGGYLVKVEPLTHPVGHCQRSGVPIEPKVSWQWFCRMGPADDAGSIAGAAIEAVRSGRIRFVPEHWSQEYYRWLTNIHDWCISRQLWWGHRIPAWHCADCGAVTVAREDACRCGTCGGGRVAQDEDVLDTWFSSALWPFSTLGWPEKTKALSTFYPNSIMETGFDIIFFWVARMIMMGLKLAGDIPFSTIYLHAMVRDALGQKMSKTKGNVVDPLELMADYGADAVRFTLLSLSAQGRDIKLSTDRILANRAFMNKLWNSARFVLMNLPEGEYASPADVRERLAAEDKWILTRLQEVSAESVRALEEYRFNEYALGLYQFIWDEFCSWYLELSKSALYGEDEEQKYISRCVLTHVLENLLRLLHPAAPFITEEIWSLLPNSKGPSIAVAAYPDNQSILHFEQEARRFRTVLDVIAAIRSIRTQNRISPSAPVNVVVSANDAEALEDLSWGMKFVKEMGRTGEMRVGVGEARPAQSGAAVTGRAVVYVEFQGFVDIQAEVQRLTKNLGKLKDKWEQLDRKLSSAAFVEKAPEEVVEEKRVEKEELEAAMKELSEHLASLA